MSDPAHRCRAFLLRAVDYGESDRVLTLLSEDRGKIAAIARGARKSHRRFGGALEQFALIDVSLARSQGPLPRLVEASLVRAHQGLAGSLPRIGAAGLVVELVREIVPEHQPEPDQFALIEQLLPLLASAGDQQAVALGLSGVLRALSLAGLGISLVSCNACGTPVPPGRRVFFDPRRGGVVCTPCGGGPIVISAAGITALRDLESRPLEALDPSALDFDAGLLMEISRVLSAFLEQHLDRPLKSASFLGQLRLGDAS